MKIGSMRLLDYWIGIPVCFLLSVFEKLKRVFGHKPSFNEPPQKILFVKPSEMGGIILSHSLIHHVKEAFPQADLYFLTFECNKDLLMTLPIIPEKNVFALRERSFIILFKDVFRVLSICRKMKVDIVFDLEFFSRFTSGVCYLSGAPKRVGFYAYSAEGLYRGDLLTHKIQYNARLHMSQMFLTMRQDLSAPEKKTPEFRNPADEKPAIRPLFNPTDEQKKAAQERLKNIGLTKKKKVILINPGEGTIPLREWPLENFISLAQRLIEDKNNFILLVGTKKSAQRARQLCQALNSDRCADLSGQTTIEEILTIFHLADTLIANDCGIAHLASLTPLKLFILFGPESPHIFAPLSDDLCVFYKDWPCSPCLSVLNHRYSSCQDNLCIQKIEVAEVYAKVCE